MRKINNKATSNRKISDEIFKRAEALKAVSLYWLEESNSWSRDTMNEIENFLDAYETYVDEVRNLNDISGTLKEIGANIDEMRTANQNTDIDYSKIELLSKQITFGKHPISKLGDGRACQVYLL